MQAAAEQVRWVSLEEIIDRQEAQDEGEVVVQRQADGRYMLVSGGGRVRRMREAGQLCVDAVIAPGKEEQLSRLLDQLVQGSIHYLDEAQAYRDLLKGDAWTAEQLAQRLGRTAATLRRKMRLLELGDEIAAVLRENGLCEGYAQELLRMPGRQGRLNVLRHVTDGGLSVKETEKLIDEVLSRMPVPMNGSRRLKPLMRDSRLYLNAIRGIVEQMRDAGLDAQMQVQTGKYLAEVRITVPLFMHKPGRAR